MSYLVLARKWRPRTFGELVGQEHVQQALVNALDSGRIHHAFLFTGTRGVGKTSVARILAKCLNCEQGISSRPCGECASCREIDAGRNPDVLEVDAASQSKVDETRELLDNVPYAPVRSRFKVYLIDEVHMLSAASFNALLKTLEEPPPHVKFLLATTDPHKLPATVLSRCLQFNLKNLSVSLIAARLKFILEAEQIGYEPAALQLLATAGDGSLRDALSLLDQLLAFGGGKADEASARAMLGTVDREQVQRLAELLAAGELAPLLDYAQSLEDWSPDYERMLLDLAGLLERLALLQAVPAQAGGTSLQRRRSAALLSDCDHRPPGPAVGARSAQRLSHDAAAHARVPSGHGAGESHGGGGHRHGGRRASADGAPRWRDRGPSSPYGACGAGGTGASGDGRRSGLAIGAGVAGPHRHDQAAGAPLHLCRSR